MKCGSSFLGCAAKPLLFLATSTNMTCTIRSIDKYKYTHVWVKTYLFKNVFHAIHMIIHVRTKYHTYYIYIRTIYWYVSDIMCSRSYSSFWYPSKALSESTPSLFQVSPAMMQPGPQWAPWAQGVPKWKAPQCYTMVLFGDFHTAGEGLDRISL